MGNQCRGDFADEISPHFDRIREVGIQRDFVAIKKIDLNRQFIVQQSLKLGVRHQSLPYLFLEICLRLIVNAQLSLQDSGFLLLERETLVNVGRSRIL